MLCILGMVFWVNAFAQGPRIPEDLSLESPDDYIEYQPLAISCMSWLVNTPRNEFPEKRMETNAFVMLWLAGTPTVKLVIDSKVLPFLEDEEDLLFPFIYGMALFQIKHADVNDKAVLHAEGLKTVVEVCERCRCVSKSNYLKKIRKAYKHGKLVELATEWLK